MSAIRLRGTGDLSIYEEPVSIAGIGEALIHAWVEFEGEKDDGRRLTGL